MSNSVEFSPPGGGPGSPTGRVVMSPVRSGKGERTSSGSRLLEPIVATMKNQNSPMPDYMRPIMRDAVKRWKNFHEENMMKSLLDKRNQKKAKVQSSRDEARRLARKIPMEMLAKDWFRENMATVEVRAFLVEKVLPTLILGVEKLLMEVDKKGLAETNEPDPNFNPVNFLAQYLLRNNPKFSNFSEASPYIRGLREVSEELKEQLFSIEDNRLARIKADAKKKRDEREKAERLRTVELERRKTCLKKQFLEWNVGDEGKLELAMVQNALLSFEELSEQYPTDVRKRFSLGQELEPTDENGISVMCKEFVKYLIPYISDVPNEVFESFLTHLSGCAVAYRGTVEQDARRMVLSNLFLSCDHSGVGLVDRHRVLNLFELFYDKTIETSKQVLRNPRAWPVVEIDEAESEIEESDTEKEREAQDLRFINNQVDVTDETKGTIGDADQSRWISKELEAELRDKGDLPLVPPKTQETLPPATQQTGRTSVSFAEGTRFERENSMVRSQSLRTQSQLSAFDQDTLNMPQFVQLTETFLGDLPLRDIFESLVKYVHEGYDETEEEKMERLRKSREEHRALRRKNAMNLLFEMWDNDGSGFLDLEEVESMMEKYKDGMEHDSILKAKKAMAEKWSESDTRLSKREFREFVNAVADLMPGEDALDYFVEFLTSCVERSYAERIRGEARKKWLNQITKAAETGGASMEPVYRTVFQALYKDAETHGGDKVISASIGMLERNISPHHTGDTLLRYVASTPNDAIYVLGKCLYRDMKNISFASVDSGKPLHVPRVAHHGNITFWNTDRPQEEREGSFIVIPLKDHKKRVFGVLGIDTLADPQTKAIFITHEIQFFQGIAKSFSIAFHQVDVSRKTMRIAESAISWIRRRSNFVQDVTVYLVEPFDENNKDYVLRKMMNTDDKGNAVIFHNPSTLQRKDNLFRDYLFKCVDSSESVSAQAYGERHLTFPVRDADGCCVVCVDISIGSLEKLPVVDNKEVTHMLKLLQLAYSEVSADAAGIHKATVLEADKEESGGGVEILFDRLMLLDLRRSVADLNMQAYAEMRSYPDPPAVIHLILQAVLGVFYPEELLQGELEDWLKCRQYVTADLMAKVLNYDPTGNSDHVPLEKIDQLLNGVPHNQVNKQGSRPAQQLYSWVFVCMSLIHHTRKMAENKRGTVSNSASKKDVVPTPASRGSSASINGESDG